MVFTTLDKNNYSIKQILNNNGHFVICGEAFTSGNLDIKLKQELSEVGITEKDIWQMIDAMNSNPIHTPGEINPIYQCCTLYPSHNITLMYPYFSGLYFQNYIEDVLKATNLMETKEIYFSHHCKFLGIDTYKKALLKKEPLDISINFLV